jgi:aminopeptidase YwaD
MRILYFLFLLSCSFFCFGQNNKIDKSPLGKLKMDVQFLASSSLNGRLTGSVEANQVADYIESRFKQIGIEPYKLKYKWDFTARTGVTLDKNAYFKIARKNLLMGKDFVFLPYGKGNSVNGMALPNVNEEGNVWLLSARQMGLFESNNPQKLIFEKSKDAIEKGATSVVVFNDIDIKFDLNSMNLNTFEPLEKPVVFINYGAFVSCIKNDMRKDWLDIEALLSYADENTTGKNVVAMIDNHAPISVVIAANYDHVGNVGEKLLGADNNASGVAALLSLAEQIKALKLMRYNYVFIAFAGKEQDMQGSKAFLTQNEAWLNGISCMINIDRIGKFNTKTKALYLGGYGTSSKWEGIASRANKNGFDLMIDSSGQGLSDQNSFYKKNIPVLNISAGYSDDFMTSNDNYQNINWNGMMGVTSYIMNVIAELDKETKLVFNKTNDILPKLEKTKHNLGIIPDLSYAKNGIRVNHCYINKLASKAGLKYGDVISKIGPLKIVDMDDYLKAMNKIDKDIETTILVNRNEIEYKFFVTFQ